MHSRVLIRIGLLALSAAAAASLLAWPLWFAFHTVCVVTSAPPDVCSVVVGPEAWFFEYGPYVCLLLVAAFLCWLVVVPFGSLGSAVGTLFAVAFAGALVWLPRPYFPENRDIIIAALGVASVLAWRGMRGPGMPPNKSFERTRAR